MSGYRISMARTMCQVFTQLGMDSKQASAYVVMEVCVSLSKDIAFLVINLVKISFVPQMCFSFIFCKLGGTALIILWCLMFVYFCSSSKIFFTIGKGIMYKAAGLLCFRSLN